MRGFQVSQTPLGLDPIDRGRAFEAIMIFPFLFVCVWFGLKYHLDIKFVLITQFLMDTVM